MVARGGRVRLLKEIDVGLVVAGKYALVRLLGTGAMGQVWSARHVALGQQFALKLMVPVGASQIQAVEGEQTSLKRFENEAQIAAALSRKSRNIAQVTDYGVEEGAAYLVMELLEGEGLDKRIHTGALSPNDVANVVSQVAKALTVAHAEGVTHRDLKPANIFLTRSEEGALLVKLFDFGIALMARRLLTKDNRAPTKLTLKGIVLGSPSYMSPEQAMAESPDLRADVWSLAVVAYEALVGHPPFDGPTPDDTIVRICNFRPTPLRAFMPNASDGLVDVFNRAFAPNISKRFQTASELSHALSSAIGARSQMTMPLRTPNAIVADAKAVPMRSHVGPIAGVAALVALAIGAAIVVSLASRSSQQPSATTTASASAQTTALSIASASPNPTRDPVPLVVTAMPTPTVKVQHVASQPSTHPTAPTSTTPSPTVTAAPSKTVDRSGVF